MVTLISMSVGELIKKALETKRISQIELSERTGISTSQISRIVKGERGTSIENLVAIADVLGIKRDLMLRTAAGLPTPEVTSDEWVDQMNIVINSIKDKRLRGIALRFLDTLASESEESNTVQVEPNKAKGHA